MAHEFERMSKELAGMRSENRQLLRHIAISNERILKLEKRREAQSEVNA